MQSENIKKIHIPVGTETNTNRYSVFAFNYLLSNGGIPPAQSTYSQASGHTQLAGNDCELICCEQPPEDKIVRTPEHSSVVSYSWPIDTHSDPSTYGTAIYNDTGKIQLCVHGLLATAYHWMKIHNEISVSLRCNENIYKCRMIGDPFETCARISVSIPDIELEKCVLPAWLKTLGIANQVINTVASATKNGYLLVEFSPETDLRSLPPFSQEFSAITSRAVIYVAKPLTSKLKYHSYDTVQLVHMRYFAPQYGNDEDSATGSAARVVARYYKEQFSKLMIEQLSSEGGWLFTEIKNNHIDISGSVEASNQNNNHD